MNFWTRENWVKGPSEVIHTAKSMTYPGDKCSRNVEAVIQFLSCAVAFDRLPRWVED